jgi:serine/threonine-protein kinase
MNDAARELIGRTLGGRFRITGFLGEGAMASVYRAEQDGEPREVAVKIMHRELLRDATFAKRFTREAKAAAKIVHPNTTRILEHGADGDLLYLAMELLEGSDLFDTLVLRKRLPEARAARIVIQICGALEAAHAHNIVHRDLKPENVFLTRDPSDPDGDRVKVLDFGIAKILERERSSDDAPPSSEPMSAPPSSVLTRVGTIVGTPEYMSPEQAVGAPVDTRSDLYACGVLLFHMITGRPPFVGATPIEVLLQLPETLPPAPSTLQPGIHPGLEKLILKALAKLPDNRPKSARAMREALEALLPELATGSKRAPVAPPAPASGPKLPGVPGSVAIAVEGARSQAKAESEEPPATMRSTPADAERAQEAEAAPKRSSTAAEIDRALMALSEHEEEAAPEEPEKDTAKEPEKATAAEPEKVAAKEPAEAPASSDDARAPVRSGVARTATAAGQSALFASTTGERAIPPWIWLAGAAAVIAILWLLAR